MKGGRWLPTFESPNLSPSRGGQEWVISFDFRLNQLSSNFIKAKRKRRRSSSAPRHLLLAVHDPTPPPPRKVVSEHGGAQNMFFPLGFRSNL